MRIQLITPALLVCVACFGAAHVKDLSEAASVVSDQFIISFAPAPRERTIWPAPSRASHPGYYNWRFGVSGPDGFTAVATVDPSARDASKARGSLEEVVRRAVLYRCGPPGHILVCATPLAGSIDVHSGRVTVSIRDAALVAFVRRSRPAYVWRAVYFPDTILAVDSVRIAYRYR